MADRGTEARRAAVRLLGQVLGARQTLAEAEAGLPVRLPPADRARALRLARNVLRNLGRADAVLAPHLERRTPLVARNAMRLAVVEVAEGGAPAPAVVSSCVGLMRAGPRTGHLAGLANAVLRKVMPDLPAVWAELPPERLPKWLRGSLLASWGEAAVTAFEAAHQTGARVDLTPGPRMTPDIRARLDARELPTGSLRLDAPAQVSALPGFAEGAVWVQDAAAALPAHALAAQPGERVLDLCAAPGGKTLQLAARGARVTALDIAPARLDRLRANLGRTGLEADIVAADALAWSPTEPFDAILLDAPCSATGTIRRHPELPHIRDGQTIKDLAALQAALIDRALGWLKPGGRLVFATCSLLPMEGEGQAAAALARHPGLTPDRAALALPGVEPAWIGATGLRLRPDLWPDMGGMDGFFIAAFRTPA